LRVFVPGGKLRGDVEALFDDGAITEPRERLPAPECAFDGVIASGSNQGGQICFSRVRARAAGRARSATDLHEGIADGDHAFPAAALQRRAIGVVPGANGDIDVSGREFRFDDAEMSLPETVIPGPPRRHHTFLPLEPRLSHRAGPRPRCACG